MPEKENETEKEDTTKDDTTKDDKEDSYKKERQAFIRDIKKYKSEMKKLQEELDGIKKKKDEEEEEDLKNKENYKKLYEKQKEEIEKAKKEAKEAKAKNIENAKKVALQAKLNVVKPEYLQFADIDSIVVSDDGTVDEKSVDMVADKFREDYKDLVKTTGANTDPKPKTDGGKPSMYDEIFNISDERKQREAIRNAKPEEREKMFLHSIKNSDGQLFTPRFVKMFDSFQV